MASGTISFGLVAIPVKLYTTGESSQTVRFSMVHEKCGTKVKYRYYCPTDDRLVERDELTKGYEFAKGQFVLFSDEEIKALNPEATNAVEIIEFVPLDKVDDGAILEAGLKFASGEDEHFTSQAYVPEAKKAS